MMFHMLLLFVNMTHCRSIKKTIFYLKFTAPKGIHCKEVAASILH